MFFSAVSSTNSIVVVPHISDKNNYLHRQKWGNWLRAVVKISPHHTGVSVFLVALCRFKWCVAVIRDLLFAWHQHASHKSSQFDNKWWNSFSFLHQTSSYLIIQLHIWTYLSAWGLYLCTKVNSFSTVPFELFLHFLISVLQFWAGNLLTNERRRSWSE